MGRRRTTPELQKLKTMDGSPELTNTKSTSSKKIKTLEPQEPAKRKISPQIVTRARRRGASTNVDLIPPPKMMDMPMVTEDELQKDANVLTPKMFYSKKCQKKTTKSAENNEQNDIPTVKKSRRTDNKTKNKSDSDKCPEQNSNKNDDFPVVIEPKRSNRKTKQSCINKKNLENKMSVSSAQPERKNSRASMKTKTHMTAEEVITELTNDDDDDAPPMKGVSLPMTKKEKVEDKVNSRKINKDVDNNVSLKRSKTMKPANSIENKKRKVRLSLADIVNEISPDSPKKRPSKQKVISDADSLQKTSATKQNGVKKSQSKKPPNNENGLTDEWDHSLLLITDDFDDSKNVYDFEEFQIGAKPSSTKKSSIGKSDKKNSIKKTAAIKAVLNKRKVNKEVATKRKVKKTNPKTTKVTAAKKITHKVITPITTGKPAIGSKISVENQSSSTDNSGLSVSNDPFQTPSRQVMKEPVSITELEKVKVTKHIENKVVTKVNPGAAYVSDWLQLPNLPSQQFTKLKRCPMEGPTASDNLPENQPKSMMIKTSSAFNQSLLDMSSINAESRPNKPKPEKVSSKKLDPKAPTDNQPIELFTYPVAMPIKNQKDGVKKNGKCKEIKQTPVKGLMDFMYAGSVERYLKKPKENANLTSPPPIMLPKFLHAETSTPDSQSFQKLRGGGESICISPVKDFQSPASMRTYDLVSRRSSASFHAIIKNVEAFAEESKENSPQGKKTEKAKVKKKDVPVKKNKNFDEWANRMSNEFDEIEQFELSIEN